MANEAVYAGTFDPITNGHLDIIQRAARVFDTLHVAVVDEPKKSTLFNAEDRVDLVRASLATIDPKVAARVSVAGFGGLLVEYVRQRKCSVVIRGLRAVSDYEYEAQMAIVNRHLAEDIETVFLLTSEENSFISSSTVREIARYGGDTSRLVPPAVSARLQQVFKIA